jgi:hypothetical protein
MDGNGNAKIADLGCASFYNLTMTLNVGSPYEFIKLISLIPLNIFFYQIIMVSWILIDF